MESTLLHVHTEYTLLGSLLRLAPMVLRAAELGYRAIAKTDLLSTFGNVDFVRECETVGIRPVLGVELPVAAGDLGQFAEGRIPLLLYAETQEGYRNLLHLTSLAHLEHSASDPLLSLEILETHSAGVIALATCRDDGGSMASLTGRAGEAAPAVGRLRDIFGKDSLFLGLSDAELEDAQGSLCLRELADRFQIRMVAAPSIRTLRQEDAPLLDLLRGIREGFTIPTDRIEPRAAAHLPSREEMAARFGSDPDFLRATVEIAERCTGKPELGVPHLPRCDVASGTSAEEHLTRLCLEALEKDPKARQSPGRSSRRDRLASELSTIRAAGLASYFLIVHDVVAFARANAIPIGPGRGSVAGSLAAFYLGITEVDPLDHDLLFERFLHRDRSGLPDIDLDVSHRDRDRIFQYLETRYGKSHVARIATIDRLAPRSAVRDAGRALGIEPPLVDRVARLIPSNAGDRGIEDFLRESETLADLYQKNPSARALLESARSIVGLARHTSIHAGGVLVSDETLTELVALQKTAKGEVVAQATRESAEALGLLKFDLLGLRFLTAAADAIAAIGDSADPISIPMEDEATCERLARGDGVGVFQLESPGIQNLLRQVRPSTFDDLVAVLSLYRPGPIGGGFVEPFVRRRRGEEPVSLPHPDLEPILGETYGILLYQEQVMRIAQSFAGFSLAEADRLRLAIQARRGEELAGMRKRFLAGAIERSVPGETADEVFEMLVRSGGFGFNKSHSVAYALISWRTAWLMTHHPVAYLTALLNANLDSLPRLRRYLGYARRSGIPVFPPDLRRSRSDFASERSGIRAGLGIVKHLGEEAARFLVEERERGGAYRNLLDLCVRAGHVLNARSLESLIKAGAMDGFAKPREDLLAVAAAALSRGRSPRKSYQSSLPLELNPTPSNNPLDARPATVPLSTDPSSAVRSKSRPSRIGPSRARVREEREATDLFLSGHPLRFHADLLETLGAQPILTLPPVPGTRVRVAGVLTGWRQVRTRAQQTMAFATLEDEEAEIEVTLFPRALERSTKLGLEPGGGTGAEPVLAIGVIEVADGVIRLVGDSLEPLSGARARQHLVRTVEIHLPKGFRKRGQVRAVSRAYRGDVPVRFHGPGVGDAHPEELRIELSPESIRALTDVVGAKAVRIRESEGSPDGSEGRGLAWIGRVIPAVRYLSRRKEMTDEV